MNHAKNHWRAGVLLLVATGCTVDTAGRGDLGLAADLTARAADLTTADRAAADLATDDLPVADLAVVDLVVEDLVIDDLTPPEPDLTPPPGALAVTMTFSKGVASGTIALAGPTPLAPPAFPLGGTVTGCTEGTESVTCTVTVEGLAAGEYALSLDLFADDAGAGAKLALAHAVPFAITSGATTELTVVLVGIPTSLTIAATTVSSVSDGTGGYFLVGLRPRDFTVTALDAAGERIPTSNLPSFTITPSGPYDVTVGAPTAANPSAFAITPPSTWASGVAATNVDVTLDFAGFLPGETPTPCGLSGAVCAVSFAVQPRQLLAVGVGSKIAELYDITTTTPTLLTSKTLTSGGSFMTVALDDDGNLYALGSDGAAAVYDAPSYAVSHSITGLNNLGDAVAASVAGTLFVADRSVGIRGVPLATRVADATGIAATQIGWMALTENQATLFVTDLGANLVRRVDTATKTALTSYTVPGTGNCVPNGITAANGSLFVTCAIRGTLEVLRETDGVVTDAKAVSFPFTVAYDRKNRVVCVTNQVTKTGQLFSDNQDGTITLAQTVTTPTATNYVAADGQGSCWFAGGNGSAVTPVDTATFAVGTSIATTAIVTSVRILP